MATSSENREAWSLPVPAYLLDHGDPAALFTRLQRVVIHMELLQKEAMSGFPFSFSDFVILATLRREPAPHQLLVGEVAEYVLRPMGSISQVLDRIERAGLVERAHASDDRRKVIVSLTDKGSKLADEANAAYQDTRRRVFKHLDDETIHTVDASITSLLGALDTEYRNTHTH